MGGDRASRTTIDSSGGDGWAPRPSHPGGENRAPRLRLLYHPDLTRLGWCASLPDDSGWLAVGRNAPLFVAPLPGVAAALDDAQISREQLRVRWVADLERFEVEPAAAARRPLARIPIDDPFAPVELIAGRAQLPDGACLALGDRVLLGLERCRPRAVDARRMGLIGETDAMWRLRDEIREIAAWRSPALVTGPTGAGKELVARALHREGPRAGGPFVAVNCAALPEQLVESVLFGHKKGAFTSADAEEKGLFRAADGGTLLLDEIGELPLAVQPKLLRALQEGEVVPVGSHEHRPVDVRVIAATHRDPEAQVRAGGLRADLYHRLAAHRLRVPPLDERTFDVPELFSDTLARLRADQPALERIFTEGREGRPVVPIRFVVDLMRRGFPGNVRELRNVAEATARLNLAAGPFRAPEPAPPPSATPALAHARIDVPGPPAEAHLAERLLRDASDALDVAHKTVAKLLPPYALVALHAEANQGGLDGPARAAQVRARAAQVVGELLEASGYNQSTVAVALGASRSTVIKLMDLLGLTRAADLDDAAIERALDAAHGDVGAAARALRVSQGALRQRLAQDRKPLD